MFNFAWPDFMFVKKNPKKAKDGDMKCERCEGKMTVLAFTAVCDFCNPPKGYIMGADGELLKIIDVDIGKGKE